MTDDTTPPRESRPDAKTCVACGQLTYLWMRDPREPLADGEPPRYRCPGCMRVHLRLRAKDVTP